MASLAFGLQTVPGAGQLAGTISSGMIIVAFSSQMENGPSEGRIVFP